MQNGYVAALVGKRNIIVDINVAKLASAARGHILTFATYPSCVDDI